jgi:hypothetical protein
MNWKSTAFVSGAGLLATWLASVPPPSMAPRATPRAAQAPVVSVAPVAVADEIQELADRLERRNRAGDGYQRTSRDPFQFAPVREAARPELVPVTPPVDVAAPEPVLPAIHVSGIAMDRVDDKDVWTAILSTPGGVVLAREGEQVLPGWKISTIEAESVALTRPDGSILTLPLGR